MAPDYETSHHLGDFLVDNDVMKKHKEMLLEQSPHWTDKGWSHEQIAAERLLVLFKSLHARAKDNDHFSFWFDVREGWLPVIFCDAKSIRSVKKIVMCFRLARIARREETWKMRGYDPAPETALGHLVDGLINLVGYKADAEEKWLYTRDAASSGIFAPSMTNNNTTTTTLNTPSTMSNAPATLNGDAVDGVNLASLSIASGETPSQKPKVPEFVKCQTLEKRMAVLKAQEKAIRKEVTKISREISRLKKIGNA
ncbi:uncharacterized protein JN550_003076 [Neoarthrinium moseri]|uniref:uncharacterized protein n=1 Tax=Neoarthrinium moseri TaxID=1658444 RepID=UPI001FDBBC42|nr:uncharacterized protein JN550_003076 [Neoarthrinium moseri]KAI1873807.1 hypothetical protein JN550_003076 [Neoarthrinium moseri]